MLTTGKKNNTSESSFLMTEVFEHSMLNQAAELTVGITVTRE